PGPRAAPRGLAGLVDRGLRRPAGDVLGRWVDHRVGAAGGRHPAATDQHGADDRLRHPPASSRYAPPAARPPAPPERPARAPPPPPPPASSSYAARAATAASRWRVVLCTGSRSKRGRMCFPNVSIERSTCFWSRVRVSGA